MDRKGTQEPRKDIEKDTTKSQKRDRKNNQKMPRKELKKGNTISQEKRNCSLRWKDNLKKVKVRDIR